MPTAQQPHTPLRRALARVLALTALLALPLLPGTAAAQGAADDGGAADLLVELGRLQAGLDSAQGLPARAGLGERVRDVTEEEARRRGQQILMSFLPPGAPDIPGTVDGIVDFVQYARENAEEVVKGCNYSEFLGQADQAMETATTLMRRMGGDKPEDSDYVPMTNYLTKWFNRRNTGSTEASAELRTQQLIGQLEQGCQAAVQSNDMRRHLGMNMAAAKRLRAQIGGLLGALNLVEPPPPPVPVEGPQITQAWSVAFDSTVAGGVLAELTADDPQWAGVSQSTRQISGTMSDALLAIERISEALLSHQEDLLLFATRDPESETGEFACPDPDHPDQRIPVVDDQDTYTLRDGTVKFVCGFASPDRTRAVTTQIALLNNQLDALETSVVGSTTELTVQQLAIETRRRKSTESANLNSVMSY